MAHRKCPHCSGELDKQRQTDWTPVYVCMGDCGRQWNVFDLNILLDKGRTSGASIAKAEGRD
jgi:hypothetical protein